MIQRHGSRRVARLAGSLHVFAVFVLVPLVLVAVWIWWPVVQTVTWSFYRWDGFSPSVWVGLDNYVAMIQDPIFRTALANTGVWLVGMTLVPVLFGLPLAMALDLRLRGSRLFASIFYLPVVLSFAVIGLIWSWMYQPEGLINEFFRGLGLEGLARPWLSDESTALLAVLVAAMWRQVGYAMMIYLAGLKTVDRSLLEAAQMDGANPWQRFRHVILPALAPVHAIVVVITIIDSLRAFDLPWVMTKGGPYNSSDLIATLMYNEAVFNYKIGYGSAIATTLFALSLVLIISYLVRVLRAEAR